MSDRRLLFFLGGSQSTFEAVAEEFVPAAGGVDAVIALLLSGQEGWEDYVSRYTEPWKKRGVVHCHTIVPDANGNLDSKKTQAVLRKATGIFIGGGDTTLYHRFYVTTPVGSVIRERYQEGVPVAGLSAGAVIAPEVCVIPPQDTGRNSIQLVGGLGLIRDLIVGVHYTTWEALPHLIEAMVDTKIDSGLGIDEGACAVLENGELKRVLGQSVYEIEMTDFKTEKYNVTRVP